MNRHPDRARLFAALALCCLGFGALSARGGVPAYDAVQVIVPNSQVTQHLSQFNLDGAMAWSHYDEGRHLWAIGIWLPRPLYGQSAGYHELYTSAGEPFQGNVWPHIDNAGNVNYYHLESGVITLGGATWGGSYSVDSLPFPGWNDSNVIHRDFTTITLAGTTSDPVPFETGLATVTHRDGNSFQPAYTHHYPVVIDGGFQAVSPPEGAFGQLRILTRSGHAVWAVADIDPNYPGRRPGDFRYVAVTPNGTFPVEQGYFMNGRGDITYGGTKILLAAPLGPLGPGLHNQADIPGMPASHFVGKFNSSGVFVTWQATSTLTENNVHILSGGKAAPLRALLPPSVPVASDGMHRSDVQAINEAGMLLYGGVAFVNGQNVFTGTFVLTPTLDCDVTLSGTQPYRLDEEFDLDVTVRNVAGAPVTNVRVEGDQPGSLGISVSSGPQFDILSGPTPPGPVTIAPGGTQVFRFHCRGKKSGVGTVTAKVKGTSASGTNLRTQASTPIDIEQRGDLLIKLLEEQAASFAIDNVYQRVAATDAQARKVEIVSENDARTFEIKVQNDEPRAFAMRLFAVDAGSSAIPLRYFFGTTEITNQIKASGWPTPELAAGGSIIVRVEFGPPEGATAGDSRSANISLHPIDGSNVLDRVRMEVGNAPPIEVILRRPMADGLTTESISAGTNAIDAPLEFKTDRAVLETLPSVSRGLVADGVSPLLLEMIVPPEKFEGLEDDIHYNVSIEILSGGTLDGTPIDARLGVLKDGEWSAERELTFTTTENKHFARISPVGSDELQFSGGANELKLRLRFTEAESGAPAGDKTLYLRKPPIALVHGYNTNGSWGDAFAAILGASRPRFTPQGGEDFVRTIRYGQDPPEGGVTAKENTVMPFSNLAPILGAEFEEMKSDLLQRWALTRFDVVAHSQGGVLTRMLCSKNANGFAGLPFRNADNFYRGRFHRVVTIGSPHNGTRLVRFVLDLQERLQQGNINGQLLPLAVSEIMIRTGISQDKFDPFGVQIARINQNDPNAPWYPDPAARFHLIQTTVHDGSAPNPSSYSYSEWALGLNFVGDLVIPRGSDGVVDFDSMAATSPEAGQGDPTNMFRMPASQQICHAFIPRVPETTGSELVFADMFGGDFGQTESTTAAHHAIDALDQSSEISPAFRVFGPFRLPTLLPQSVADSIRAAADRITARPDTIFRLGSQRGVQDKPRANVIVVILRVPISAPRGGNPCRPGSLERRTIRSRRNQRRHWIADPGR